MISSATSMFREEVRRAVASSRRALYHAAASPSVFSDANGEYIGFDDKIHHVEEGRLQYANFSGWDIYRCQVELLAMLFPKQGERYCRVAGEGMRSKAAACLSGR